jgi:predicted aspartyl protease
MALRYPYKRFPTLSAVVSLGGRKDRPRPIITVTLIGPTGSQVESAFLDTLADDTVFPEDVANAIGLDLTHTPVGQAAGIGKVSAALRFAEVTLRIVQGTERREWRAWVGFTATALNRPLLGFAGFLQFFTATFYGDREEVELAVNSLYQGT